MVESASAYVSIIPVSRGAGKLIEKQINPEALGVSVGSKMSGGFLKSVGSMAVKTTAVIGGAVTAIGATIAAVAAKKGIDRLLDIDDAKGKLKGLGHDVAGIATIMDSALASVKGTAFGLGDAATVAASAVAAGVKPGQDLTRYLSLTADAATIAGVSLDEMGSIINKTTTSGKVYTDSLNQLADRGIPIFQWLQDEYGVSADTLSDMVKKGKVDAATFRKVIENNIGGAALASGQTVRGSFANVGAALGRLGALFLGGAVANAPMLFTSVMNAVDKVTAALEPFSAVINEKVGVAMVALAGWIDGVDFGAVIGGVQGLYDLVVSGNFSTALRDAFGFEEDSGFVTFILGARDAVSDFFSSLGGGDASGAFSSIGTSLATLGPAFSAFGAELPNIGGAVATLAGAGLMLLTDVLSFLADNVDTIIAFMPLIVAGFVAWRIASFGVLAASQRLSALQLKALPITTANTFARLAAARAELQLAAATKVSTGAQNGGIVASIRATASTVAARAAMVAGAIATGAAAAGQWLLNAAMTANPIGIVVAAIAALVAGLVWFFTQTELGQGIVAEFTGFLGEAWTNIAAGATWLYETILKPVFEGIWAVISWFGSVAFAVFDLIATVVRTVLGAVFSWLWETIIQPVFGWIGDKIATMWAGVQIIFAALVGFVRDTLGPIFTWLYETIIKPVFEGIGSAIKWVWENVIKPVFDFLSDAIQNKLPAAFEMGRDAIGKAWDLIQDVAKKPIRFVVETVINDGIIKNFNKVAEFFGSSKIPEISLPSGFARGGVLPGYQSAKRDEILTPMRKGEGVLVPEVVRALGPGFVHALNAAGNSGGVGGVRSLVGRGYASGGIIDGAIDWLKDAAGAVSSFIADPQKAMGDLINGLIKQIPGLGGMLDVAKGMGAKLVSSAVEKIQELVGSFNPAGNVVGNGSNGQLSTTDLMSVPFATGGPGVGAYGGMLRRDAAVAAIAANAAARAATGTGLSLTEGYRDLAGQQMRWNMYKAGKGNLAATPGTSNHGFGTAGDFGSSARSWFTANGSKYGWYPTGLGFSQREPWHFDFKGAPRLADGGIVSRQRGGIMANIGEGRYDEAVVPLTPRMKDALANVGNSGDGNGSRRMVQNTYYVTTAEDAVTWTRGVNRENQRQSVGMV